MRFFNVPLIALWCLAAHAQTLEDRLKSARENIDAHAVVSKFDPPEQSISTKWHVARMDGCTVELTQSWHREASGGAVTSDGIFDLTEDKIVTWTFSLASLRPADISAETSEGLPHLSIFAFGDAFHLKTDFSSKIMRKDGGTVNASTWSTPGNDRNLWMFFNSPDADNKVMVKALELDLREAVRQCDAPKLLTKVTKGGNSRHARRVALQLETIP